MAHIARNDELFIARINSVDQQEIIRSNVLAYG